MALTAWGAYGGFGNSVVETAPRVSYTSRLGAASFQASYALRFGPADGGLIVQPEAQLVYSGYGQDLVMESDGTIVSKRGWGYAVRSSCIPPSRR
jgi:outer membrane autotransporter protein